MLLPIIMKTVSRINKDISTSCEATFEGTSFHGGELLGLVSNTPILNASVDYILLSKSFQGPLMKN